MNEKAGALVGVAWYRRDEWDLLKAVSVDNSLEDTYEAWEKGATKLIADLKPLGLMAVPVDIRVSELVEWCQRHNLPADGSARARLAAEKLQQGKNIDINLAGQSSLFSPPKQDA